MISQDLIAYLSVGLAIAFLLGLVINVFQLIKGKALFKKNKALNKELSHLNLEHQKVLERLNEIELEETDGFVKFLSESRQHAFDYIENVQGIISTFKAEIEADILWLETYGMSLETGKDRPILKITSAYRKLMETLPEH